MKIQHVAIIMDGNRRWAKQNGFKAITGHRKVAEEGTEKLVDHCIKLGIPYLTLWAWSSENWKRNPQEVEAIMSLFRETFDTSSKLLHKKGVKIQVIGDMTAFDKDIQDSVAFWVKETRDNKKITVIFALNYGGRDEIVRGVGKLVWGMGYGREGAINIQEITAELFSQYLDTKDFPDPDLIIRPGGEKRLSGFLAWQNVYSELYFTDVLMPDFDEKELDKALEEFSRRKRRFGG